MPFFPRQDIGRPVPVYYKKKVFLILISCSSLTFELPSEKIFTNEDGDPPLETKKDFAWDEINQKLFQ